MFTNAARKVVAAVSSNAFCSVTERTGTGSGRGAGAEVGVGDTETVFGNVDFLGVEVETIPVLVAIEFNTGDVDEAWGVTMAIRVGETIIVLERMMAEALAANAMPIMR